jgi:hypothetical protein
MDPKGPETPVSIENHNDYFDGDARRELESTRHSKESHTVTPPLEAEDMQSNVPVSHVGVDHVPSKNTLTEILEHNADAALDEATNRRHAHIDRAQKGASIQR